MTQLRHTFRCPLMHYERHKLLYPAAVVIIIDVHVLCCTFVVNLIVTRDVSNNKSLFLIEKKR